MWRNQSLAGKFLSFVLNKVLSMQSLFLELFAQAVDFNSKFEKNGELLKIVF
jgi:hypothetical protein